MPYCPKCGSEVNADATFCKTCGKKIETEKPAQTTPVQTPPAQTIPEYVPPKTAPPPAPVVGYATQTYAPSSTKSKLWLTLFIIALVILLAVGSILGVSYASASNKLNTTKATLATTQQQVNSLQDDKTSLEGKLTNANSSLATTQQTLSSTQQTLILTQGELTTTKTQLSSTQSQLSNTQSSLASAQNQVAALNTQLSTSQSTITTLQNQIAASKLKYFTNQAALTSWLSSQPLFTATHYYDNCVNLQNLALKQGYLLVACVEADTNGNYYDSCQAYCSDGYVYYVSPSTHTVWIDRYEGSEPAP